MPPDKDPLYDAVSLFRNGQLDRAIETCIHVLKENPEREDAMHLLGLFYHERDEPGLALPYLQKLCSLNPNNATAFCSLGAVQYKLNHYPEAVISYQHSIEQDPTSPDAYFGLGQALEIQDLVEEALHAYFQVLQLDEQHAHAYYSVSLLLKKAGRFPEAKMYALKALALLPDSEDVRMLYASILFELEEWVLAQLQYQEIVLQNPTLASAHTAIGTIFDKQGHLSAAIVAYKRSIEIDPAQSEAYTKIGRCLLKDGQQVEALEAWCRSVSNNPDQPELHNELGVLYCTLEDYQRSHFHLTESLRQNPDNAFAHYNLGNLLQSAIPPERDAAIACYRRSIQCDPEFAQAYHNLGNLLLIRNQKEEGLVCYRKAVSLHPEYVESHLQIALRTTFQTKTDEVEAMESLYHSQELAEEKKVYLAFGLGKIYDDLEQYEQSFRYYRAANRLRRKQYDYSIADTRSHVDKIKNVFCSQFFSSRSPIPAHGNPPIFIVGMMRSGTTLVEQILSSHPQVFGAGECNTLPKIVDIYETESNQNPYPDFATECSVEDCIEMAKLYQRTQSKYAPSAKYICDKLPHNFYFLGLIHLLFPHAKIVLCLRNPMDTCWSMYRQNFTGHHPYTYDLEELGLFYGISRRLFAHWRETIPQAFYEIHYENLVKDTEAQVRALLEYCDLPWHDGCLQFYDNQRAVHTPSLFQVRQPIYPHAMGQWRKHAANLR
ncbi:MAG: sulfotransferase, partial [Myxococcota bacterium]|nr:sulfotransferase [Myxococcota bacterium]